MPVAAAILLGGATAVGAALVARHVAAPIWPPPDWAMVVCDIGQGDAILLHVGAAEAVAVDTGPDLDREDACLHRYGITRIDRAVLTHFHADHIGGLAGLLRGRRVAEIETTTVDDPPAGAAEVRRLAAAAQVPVVRVRVDERVAIGPVSWQVLWPDASMPAGPPDDSGSAMSEDMMPGDGMASDGSGSHGGAGRGGGSGAEGSGPNNTSIVMAVSIACPGGPLRILLTGDIETPVQQTLLAEHRDDLRADVLKVPHHGSANQDPDFIDAVGPVATVISVGAGNPYGHPAPRTVRLMGSGGARVYRTDLDGDVVISGPQTPGAPLSITAGHGAGTAGDTSTAPSDQPTGRTRTRSHHRGHPTS